MTVSTTTSFSSVAGDDVLTSHDFGFEYDLKTDVAVEKNSVVSGVTTPFVLGEDYTIAGTVASFSSVLESDHTYAFTRDTGHVGRGEFPPVHKFRTSGFENSLDVNAMIHQEDFIYSNITSAIGDGNQAFTTTEKIIMPSFSGVQITRSGFYILMLDARVRPDNINPRADTEVKVRLRIGKDGDLTSDIEQTKSFYFNGDQDNVSIFYQCVVFDNVYMAAGQKFCLSAEANVTPDGDFTIFSNTSTVWVIQ